MIRFPLDPRDAPARPSEVMSALTRTTLAGSEALITRSFAPSVPLVLALVALGCTDKSTPIDTGGEVDTGSGYTSVETGVWDPVDSGDSDSGDTSGGDTGGGDTAGDTGEVTVEPVVTTLTVYPVDVVLAPGGQLTLRSVGSWDEGATEDIDVLIAGGSFTSSDEAIATVDEEGTVTAMAAGSATLTVTVGETAADTVVEVTEEGVLRVTVTDAVTGELVHDLHLTAFIIAR